MNIDTYPKFARNTLLLSAAMFAGSGIFLYLRPVRDLFGSGASLAATAILMSLLLPLMAALPYLADAIDRELKTVSFVRNTELSELVRPLLKGSGYSVNVGHYVSNDANAFAISSVFGTKAAIAFSTALISTASKDQLIAIAAHEVAHVLNGDSRNKSWVLAFSRWAKTYPLLAAEISRKTLKLWLPMVVVTGGLTFFTLWTSTGFVSATGFLPGLLRQAAIVGLPLATCVLGFRFVDRYLNKKFFAYSRQREFAADALAATMVSPAVLISALELLADPAETVNVFDSHPPLADRIRRLRKLAEEQSSKAVPTEAQAS
ncbi:M48 family metallopeptidase [Cupriavidus pauculus]|uniref:M48 family metallopeptidase n=1 Tax=Cupriavidus pauculus TaxID=82633 RepID=UPI001EE2B3CE|nr:M48 family metalloprotease [Cupriavidus pauculus]GJG98747.1 hypothetical protein CBA19C6_29680 [Cupriavidus pauculus]